MEAVRRNGKRKEFDEHKHWFGEIRRIARIGLSARECVCAVTVWRGRLLSVHHTDEMWVGRGHEEKKAQKGDDKAKR